VYRIGYDDYTPPRTTTTIGNSTTTSGGSNSSVGSSSGDGSSSSSGLSPSYMYVFFSNNYIYTLLMFFYDRICQFVWPPPLPPSHTAAPANAKIEYDNLKCMFFF
jgi:hypothetical protein